MDVLTLTGFETTVGFVDDVQPTTTTYHPAIAMAITQ